MSFVEQADVFDAVEPVIKGVFEEFSTSRLTLILCILRLMMRC